MEISNSLIASHLYMLMESDYFDEDTQSIEDAIDQLNEKGGSLVSFEPKGKAE